MTAPDSYIMGTTGWQELSIVSDVPTDAQDIALGEVLWGSGKVSIADVRLEWVGSDLQVTPLSNYFNKTK